MAFTVAFVTKAAGVTLTRYTVIKQSCLQNTESNLNRIATNKPQQTSAYLKDNTGLGDQTIVASPGKSLP